jgi:hypothetical protein
VSKIKYYLRVVNGSVIFSILEQKDITHFTKSTDRLFSASNGWKVLSNEKPDISFEDKIVFLRGTDKTKDEDIVVIKREKCQGHYSLYEIEEAIEEWATLWEGWDADKKAEKIN